MSGLRIVGGDIVALVQHVELNESGWVETATARAIRFLFWLLDEPADSQDLYAKRDTIGLNAATQAQVTAAVESLTRDGSLVSTGAKYKLSEEARERLTSSVAAAEALETRVIEKVIASARATTRNSEVNGPQLWSLFRNEFVIPFIREFGARAYELITGQSTNVGQTAFIAEFLAKFDQTRKAVLEAMILSLLDKDDESCRSYILSILNTHFYQTSVSLPSGVVEKVFPTGGKNNKLRLILDTNFIFSLFELHSNPSNEAVSLLTNIISKIPKNIDVRMYVLPTTILEFRRSLSHYEGLAKSFRPTRNIVDGALRFGVSGVLETYFSRVRDSGYKISAADYFRPFHDNITAMLSQHNVAVLNGEDDKYAEDQDTIDDTIDQQAFYKQKFINDPKRQKSYEQIWHDVLLWHFTADRRPSIADTVFEAQWVGVTIDYGLLAFDGFKRKGNGVPVVVHPASLVQALQLLLPTNENFERAILALMQMPFLFESFNPADERITQKILGTLSRFDTVDDLSSDTIIQLLGNRALRGRMESTSSKDEELVLIRDAIIDHAADAERRAFEAQQKLETAVNEQRVAEERLRLAERTRHEDRASNAIDTAAIESAKADVERQNLELKRELEVLRDSQSIANATNAETRLFAISAGGAAVAFGVLALVVSAFREALAPHAPAWAPVALYLLAFTVPMMLLERISRRWSLIASKWYLATIRWSAKWLIWLIGFLVLSIIGPLVWELVDKDLARWIPALRSENVPEIPKG